MTIVWSAEALDDLESLYALIAKDSPKAARDVALSIVSAVETILPSRPHAGRPGRIPGTRELVAPGATFVVPYRAQAGQMQILRVYNGARRWPDRA